MEYRNIDITAFPSEREKRLKSIYRFSLFKTMFYRSNLWLHSFRVLYILEELLPSALKHIDIDSEKARILALVHDDAEIITGDIQAGQKAQMTEKELAVLDTAEEDAIDTLAAQYPAEIHGYNYKELLMHALRKDCPEAQLVSYADKIDAYCEDVHELLAGNPTVLTSYASYIRIFATFHIKYPLLEGFLKAQENQISGIDIWTPMEDGAKISIESFPSFFKPHTKESLSTNTDLLPIYKRWREVILQKGGEEMQNWLTEKKEAF